MEFDKAKFMEKLKELVAYGKKKKSGKKTGPDWGWILQNGIQFIKKAAWISMAPGLAIVWTVLSFNLVGEGVKELLDPRTRV